MATVMAIVFGVLFAGMSVVAAVLWRKQAGHEASFRAAGARIGELERLLGSAREAAEGHERTLGEMREKAERLATELGELRIGETRLREEVASERRVFAERETSLKREQEALAKQFAELDRRMGETFEALSAKSLRAASEDFLKRAREQFESQQKEDAAELEKRKAAVEQLVKPIGETLAATRERLEAIEKSRTENFARFQEHMQHVIGASGELRDETARLTRALSRPEVRGQYGEVQLRRVAELAGMTSYCDFIEQASTRDGEGNLLRPDMVVTLPNERVIAVDAKTNTFAYIEAVNAKDEAEREAHLDRFARHVAEQAKKLADKKYWSAWEGSPEFTVMFVPGDHFIDAALARRPELLEHAAQHGVILASPSTLIGLLRAVAVGWREHGLAEEARELFDLGRELHERAAVAFEHAAKLGDSIRQSVERYNRFVGSIDSRVLPTLRRFEDAGVKSSKELPDAPEVTVLPRGLQALPAAGDGGRRDT